MEDRPSLLVVYRTCPLDQMSIPGPVTCISGRETSYTRNAELEAAVSAEDSGSEGPGPEPLLLFQRHNGQMNLAVTSW